MNLFLKNYKCKLTQQEFGMNFFHGSNKQAYVSPECSKHSCSAFDFVYDYINKQTSIGLNYIFVHIVSMLVFISSSTASSAPTTIFTVTSSPLPTVERR